MRPPALPLSVSLMLVVICSILPGMEYFSNLQSWLAYWGMGNFWVFYWFSYRNEFYCITQRPNVRILLVAKCVHPNYAVGD